MKKKRRKLLLLLLDAALVLGLVLGVSFCVKRIYERDRLLAGDALNRRFATSIRYRGTDYPLKRNLTTVLLIGTDNFDDERERELEAYYNNRMADFVGVLVFDHDAKTVTPFQISRDTMCQVPWISVNGIQGGTELEQITFAHTYGSGREDSCINTRTAVENLLFGVPMQSFLSFTMDTVPLMNDLVGGVTVTLEEDLPDLGEEYVKGAELTLWGDAALRFVRYRRHDVVDANRYRMGRQRQYLAGFTDSARAAAAKDPELAVKAFDTVDRFLCTDLSVEKVSDMVDRLCEYEILPVVSPEGSYREGLYYAEFYPDEDSLWSCVKGVFCA